MWSSWDFLSPLILQKMKEDNIGQLGDYDAPFCEQRYTHRSCYISLSKFKSFDQLIPPKLLQTLDIYQLWYYRDQSLLIEWRFTCWPPSLRRRVIILKNSQSLYLKSQLGDYDAPFCEQRYTHRSCYISLSKFKSFDQLIPPKLLQTLDIYQLWYYRDQSLLIEWRFTCWPPPLRRRVIILKNSQLPMKRRVYMGFDRKTWPWYEFEEFPPEASRRRMKQTN